MANGDGGDHGGGDGHDTPLTGEANGSSTAKTVKRAAMVAGALLVTVAVGWGLNAWWSGRTGVAPAGTTVAPTPGIMPAPQAPTGQEEIQVVHRTTEPPKFTTPGGNVVEFGRAQRGEQTRVQEVVVRLASGRPDPVLFGTAEFAGAQAGRLRVLPGTGSGDLPDCFEGAVGPEPKTGRYCTIRVEWRPQEPPVFTSDEEADAYVAPVLEANLEWSYQLFAGEGGQGSGWPEQRHVLPLRGEAAGALKPAKVEFIEQEVDLGTDVKRTVRQVVVLEVKHQPAQVVAMRIEPPHPDIAMTPENCIRVFTPGANTGRDYCRVVVTWTPKRKEDLVDVELWVDWNTVIGQEGQQAGLAADKRETRIPIVGSSDVVPGPAAIRGRATLEVEPEALDFGETSVRRSVERGIQITVQGAEAQVMDIRPGVEIRDRGVVEDASAYGLDCVRNYVPGAATGRDMCRLLIRWTPTEEGVLDGVLVIRWETGESQARDRYETEIPVKGNAGAWRPGPWDQDVGWQGEGPAPEGWTGPLVPGQVVGPNGEHIGLGREVLDADGNIIGRIDEQGRFIDRDGNLAGVLGADGRIRAVRGAYDGPLEEGQVIGDNGEVMGPHRMVYDRDGNVLGRLDEWGQLVDKDGNVIAVLDENGKLVTPQRRDTWGIEEGAVIGPDGERMGPGRTLLDRHGNVLGTVDEHGIVRNADGEIIGAIGEDGRYVPRFRIPEVGTVVGANGETIGEDNTLLDRHGNVLGTIGADGKVRDADGNVIGEIGTDGRYHPIEWPATGRVPPEGTVVGDNGEVMGPGGTVLDAEGNVIGYMGENGVVVDADGNVVGWLGPDGKLRRAGDVVGMNGETLGENGQVYDADGTLLGTVNEKGMLVDEDGTIVGWVDGDGVLRRIGDVIGEDGETLGEGGQVLDKDGNVLGTLNEDGLLVAADGTVAGWIDAQGTLRRIGDVVGKNGETLGEGGQIIDRDGNVIGTLGADGKVRDAEGNVIGWMGDDGRIQWDGEVIGHDGETLDPDGQVFDRDGALIGVLGRDGKVRDAEGNVLGWMGPDGKVVWNGQEVGENGETIGDGRRIFDRDGTVLGTLGDDGLVRNEEDEVVGWMDRDGKVVWGGGDQGFHPGRLIGDDGEIMGPNRLVLGADGTPIGRMGPGGHVVDEDGRVVKVMDEDGNLRDPFRRFYGRIAPGTVIGPDGERIGPERSFRGPHGEILGTVDEDGVVRDRNGKITGILDEEGKIAVVAGEYTGDLAPGMDLGDGMRIGTGRNIVDAQGNVIGRVDEQGRVQAADGSLVGIVDRHGRLVRPGEAPPEGVVPEPTATRRVLDRDGNFIGELGPDGLVRDRDGRVVGMQGEDGAIRDNQGNVIGEGGITEPPRVPVAEDEADLQVEPGSVSLGQHLHPPGETRRKLRVSPQGKAIRIEGVSGFAEQSSKWQGLVIEDGDCTGQGDQGRYQSEGGLTPGTIQVGDFCEIMLVWSPLPGSQVDGQLEILWREAGGGNRRKKTVRVQGGVERSPQTTAKGRISAAIREEGQRIAAGRGRRSLGKMRDVVVFDAWRRPGIHDARYRWHDDDYEALGIDRKQGTSSRPVRLTHMVLQNTYMHAVTTQWVNAKLPSPITAVIEKDVYSTHGAQVVIPQGSRVVGMTEAFGVQGSRGAAKRLLLNMGGRINVKWERIVLPDGTAFSLSARSEEEKGGGPAPALGGGAGPGGQASQKSMLHTADLMGNPGLPGIIDPKELETYVSILSTTAISALVALTRDDTTVNTNQSPEGGVQTTQTITAKDRALEQVQAGIEEIAQHMAEFVVPEPTVSVPGGTRILLIPAVDLWLKPAERSDRVDGALVLRKPGATPQGLMEDAPRVKARALPDPQVPIPAAPGGQGQAGQAGQQGQGQTSPRRDNAIIMGGIPGYEDEPDQGGGIINRIGGQRAGREGVTTGPVPGTQRTPVVTREPAMPIPSEGVVYPAVPGTGLTGGIVPEEPGRWSEPTW